MISTLIDMPSRAAACAGSRVVAFSATSGALRTVTARPMADMASMAGSMAAPMADRMPRVMRQRRLTRPWPGQHQGRSVSTGTCFLARNAEANPRHVATNGGYVVLIGDDVRGPDPWRPHPV